MNFLDRTIGFFAPEHGLRRARSRAAMDMIVRAYDGAQLGRRTENWLATGASASAEIGPALSRLRERSRALVRNNCYAARAVSAVACNLVGTGVNPRAESGRTRADTAADALWLEWSAACDADGITDFAGLQALVVRAIVESGECLVRIRDRKISDGLPVPLQLQVLEPDLLDLNKNEERGDGSFILQGVEFDTFGRRRAYWLFPHHPGEAQPLGRSMRGDPYTSQRVSAVNILHLFERLRPGQVRGVPWLAPALIKMHDLDDYDEAELVRKKVEACFAAFVTDDDERTLGPAALDTEGRRVETLEPGMIEYLAPGKDVRFATPAHAGGYAEYMRVQLHAIAAGVGLTYELLTGDLSMVNYSSIRAGLLEFRRRMEALQWQMLIPGLCQPVWNRFILTAQISGRLAGNKPVPAAWTPPRFEAVDPVKDVAADVTAVRAGLMSLKEAIARQGYAPDQVLTEISETNALLDKLGIVLDTDPRRATQTGNPRPAAGAAEPAEESKPDEQ